MSLNRKAIVMAVGAALAAPAAYAQVTSKAGSDWEFYGKFWPEMDRVSGSSPTKTGTTISTLAAITNNGNSNLVTRTEMLVGNSYLGFRGSKSIGSGMKAIWQVEQTVSIDEGVGSTLATRDSFLGIEGGWGTLRLGFMDTPFKKAGDVVGFLGVSSGNFVQTNPLLRNVGFGQGNGGVNSNASRFHERRGNAIDFGSPIFFGGLQYLAQYSLGSQANPSEASKTTGGGAGTGTIPRDPWVMSQAVKWESGPWYFAVMHEVHFDFFGGSINSPLAGQKNDNDPLVHSKDQAAQATAMFKVGGHTFEIDYIKKMYKEDAGASATPNGRFQSYKNTAWMAAWEARWSSQWRTAVTFVGASEGTCTLFNAACSTTGLEGSQVSLGASYYLDPSTYLFLIGSVVANGASARYDNVSNGSPATGEDVLQIAFGLAHSF